ncbi:MAG: ABC transporter substrate-binding protein [Eubacteriales bacterium]|nr:ABC transporter substrate-binding protein [Eubacteriales bacterium]
MKKIAWLLILLSCMSFCLFACTNSQQAEKNTEANAADAALEAADAETPAANTSEAELPFAGRSLNVVATSEKYSELFALFTAETGANVEFLSMSSGEVLSRIQAEGKAMADLWFGGGLDAFITAKAEGILEPFEPQGAAEIDPKFKDPEGYWIAKGITVVGFLANNQILAEKNLPVPQSWAELADPKYADEVIMSTPAVSGTMFAAVKGVLDLLGEEAGWAYFEKLDQNIPFYGKRGKDPQEKTVAGEFAIGIIPADKSAFDAAQEHDLTVVYPSDGIPWVPEGVAVFKDAPGADIAKAFIDFMLRDEIQEELARLDGKDGHQMIKPGIKGFDLGLDPAKLIAEKLPEFGSKRAEILERWAELTGEE